MGSTYVEFHDQGFEAADGTIIIWLMLLVAEIDAMPSPPDWLREARSEWYLNATEVFGYGVMPSLDEIVTGPERRDVVYALCQKAMKRLHDYGPIMSADELNRIAESKSNGCFIEDVRTEKFVWFGDYFIKLLLGDLRPEECDSRFWQPRKD